MLKYVDTKVVFRELPDEITLAINLSGCPCHCVGCHSSYLADDIGNELTVKTLERLIDEHSGISAVCFMGGDIAPNEIHELARVLKVSLKYGSLHIGWYSGRSTLPTGFTPKSDGHPVLDYIKLGPYIAERGALDCETTNQKLYYVKPTGIGDFDYEMVDITYKMQQMPYI